MTTSGFGAGSFGSSPWGSGEDVQLISAESIAENVVRIGFSGVVTASGIEVSGDALDDRLYRIDAVAGSIGLDGASARTVRVALVRQALVDEADANTTFDLVLDRAMSPYPCTYLVAVDGVTTPDGGMVTGSATVLAQRKGVVPVTIDQNVGSRDIASTSRSIA